jgi:S-adenosylmethionine decarboxylase
MANVATVERPITVVQTKTKTLVKRFGTHLTLDGYGANPKKLNDMHRVFTALNDCPDLLDMKKIITPYVVHYPGNGKKDMGGYSGMVMIAESHISIHTFPEQGFVSIDVYTCQGRLDVETARRYFQNTFEVKEWEEHIIKRGTKYPLG